MTRQPGRRENGSYFRKGRKEKGAKLKNRSYPFIILMRVCLRIGQTSESITFLKEAEGLIIIADFMQNVVACKHLQILVLHQRFFWRGEWGEQGQCKNLFALYRKSSTYNHN